MCCAVSKCKYLLSALYINKGKRQCFVVTNILLVYHMNVLWVFSAAQIMFLKSKLLTSICISSQHDGIQSKVSSRALEARGLKYNNGSDDQKHCIWQMMNNFFAIGALILSVSQYLMSLTGRTDWLFNHLQVFQLSRRAASLQKSHWNIKRKQSSILLLFSRNAGHFQAACARVCVCLSMTAVYPSQGQLSDSVCHSVVKHHCTAFSSALPC